MSRARKIWPITRQKMNNGKGINPVELWVNGSLEDIVEDTVASYMASKLSKMGYQVRYYRDIGKLVIIG